ncbi:MAG: homoserine dehydrogenase [Bacillaceae bacterium G1]|nr:homoserine dehydrogenase [Bacillota bacterium]OJF18321.1 MAG: homoserine dehydrogenase [Bacillaceae bacterium G1]
MEKKRVKVGLMGLGTVGSGVVRLIENHQEDLVKQTGLAVEIAKVLVRDVHKPRSVNVSPELLTDRPEDLLDDPELDVIIEVMGGIDPAREYVLRAIRNGKHVITANKDLLSVYGAQLTAEAVQNGCDLYYEASVGGGIPILRALNESFTADRITKIFGIVNGTTNYILTKMSQQGMPYEEALKQAQALGFAEADPTADVEGLDAARKMAILGTLGFHMNLVFDDVRVRGITGVTPEDIDYARQLGYTIKLLGIAQLDDGLVELSVEPTMIPSNHPLAAVNDEYNAIYVYGRAVGETMFYGPGAGELPTASAVVADLVAVVKNLRLGINGRSTVAPYRPKQLKSDEQIELKQFLRVIAEDKAGVLARMTQLLARYEVSLERVLQRPYDKGISEIVIVTHTAPKKALDAVVRELENLDVIREIRSRYRVEGGN